MDHWSSIDTAEKVFAWMREHAGDEDEVEFSLQTVGDALHISRMTAHRALRRLEGTGAASVTRRSGGRGYPTRYRLHREVDTDLLRPVTRVQPAA